MKKKKFKAINFLSNKFWIYFLQVSIEYRQANVLILSKKKKKKKHYKKS